MEGEKEKAQRIRRGRGRYLAGSGQTSIVSILDLLLPRQPHREWTWAMTMTRAKNSLEQPHKEEGEESCTGEEGERVDKTLGLP